MGGSRKRVRNGMGKHGEQQRNNRGKEGAGKGRG